jgi:DNA invertase Pin-like site-specific DNA recombinase
VITLNKVYGYCRVALKNAEEMSQQCKIIEDYCKDNGLKIDKYFCDNGVSGLKLERCGLNKMLDTLQSNDIVVIKDIARLSRNAQQCIELIDMIYKTGATLVVANQPDLKFNVD